MEIEWQNAMYVEERSNDNEEKTDYRYERYYA